MTRAPRSEEIERPRLVERVRASAAYPIALLIAPAGYGKSVVLRQYLASLDEPHVRFTLRAEHAELLGFLRGFTEALKDRAPHAATALAGAYERNTASPNRGADLARWMHAHLDTYSGIVAIDDLHVADADPEVAEFLTALIERTKERIHWILASRSIAGLPVATWLAYRDAEIPLDEQELRFTFDEAVEASSGFGLAIRDEELGELLALTEGWPAATTFALRTSTRSSELRNVSAVTREMIYHLLAEQVYNTLGEDERGLLEVAIALPVIDVAVLERAGFDRALPMVERLRERTAFIYEESPGIYQCHDLFRDFLRHQSALSGKRSQQAVHERAARALEANGDVEHAIEAYVNAGRAREVVLLLERSGFDLVERARSDVVSRAIEALDENTRHENATVLALQGALQAIAGKFARAESLLRRALARAGSDRDLVAITTLRLASLVANQGGNTIELLSAVGDDVRQPVARRAEALSLIAGQQAVAGNLATANAAISQVEPLLGALESDVVRAKVLHHIGIAFHHLKQPTRAFEVLTQSRDLASDLHAYGLASRASAVLSNLTVHEEDDVSRQMAFAELAADAAAKAGDAYALQTALLQMLSAEMRLGNAERSIEIEQRLATVRTSELARRYLALFRAARLAWEGRFAEAHRLVSPHWHNLPFNFDRAFSGSQYALFLAADEQPQASSQLVREVLAHLPTADETGLGRVRSVAMARAFCALAEIINGRGTNSARILRSIRTGEDPVIAGIVDAVDSITLRLRHYYDTGADRLREVLERLTALGHSDVARVLGAVDRSLSYVHAEGDSQGALTRSELDILRLLADGLVPKEIAERSGRSVYTIRVHIANVIAKLGCHGRAEAVKAARRKGLLPTNAG
ncbi:MAG TPA: LuxR C-terminal-related transcriptional regulator [Candidatus Binatia bacterium]|nr:LuxR C-terminal-related transcriptional regulator [Candidatus Binatia bacterium]